jgi:hypothetical protein
VTLAVCECLRAAFSSIFDVDFERRIVPHKTRQQLLSAGIVAAAVEALVQPVHDDGALADIAWVLEAMVHNFPDAFDKAGGITAVVSVLTGHVQAVASTGEASGADAVTALGDASGDRGGKGNPCAIRPTPDAVCALCRVLLELARSSWAFSSRRRRMRSAGVPAAMASIKAGEARSSVDAQRTAGEVLYEIGAFTSCF